VLWRQNATGEYVGLTSHPYRASTVDIIAVDEVPESLPWPARRLEREELWTWPLGRDQVVPTGKRETRLSPY